MIIIDCDGVASNDNCNILDCILLRYKLLANNFTVNVLQHNVSVVMIFFDDFIISISVFIPSFETLKQ